MSHRRPDRPPEGRGDPAGLRPGRDRARRSRRPSYPEFLDWLDAGHAAGMDYMRSPRRGPFAPRSRRSTGVRSVVMVSLVYGDAATADAARPDRGQGRALRPGRGLPRGALATGSSALLDWLQAERPGCARPRGGRHRPAARTRLRPARRAGLDRQEHDAHRPAARQLHVPRRCCSSTSSWRPTRPHDAGHCGTCTRCLDACPTDAFAGPYQLDARRCISYWTIEHKGPIPDEFADRLDGWVFGCDVCQDVCPWNRKAPAGRVPELDAARRVGRSRPGRMAERSKRGLEAVHRGRPSTRARRVGLVRNAALALGAAPTRAQPDA